MMNSFTEKVLKTIDSYNMIKEGATVIAAVSGGFDSVCMLDVLSRLTRVRKFDICVAHVNHSFRHNADDDEKYVLDLCKNAGIKAYTTKVDVAGYAAQNKISFETAGRNIRYAFLDQLLDEIPDSVAATAHNANDNAESFIMHLLRGSGLSGLTGIKAVRGRIIRPLIEQTRADIERYCAENKLFPKTDYTNYDDSYARNDIRHNVMPHLAERGGIEAIVRAARLLADDEDFLCEYTRQIYKQYAVCDNGRFIIKVKDFNKLHLSVKRRLLKYILENPSGEIGLVHIDSIISIAEKNYGGKRAVLPGGAAAMLEKGNLIITKEEKRA